MHTHCTRAASLRVREKEKEVREGEWMWAVGRNEGRWQGEKESVWLCVSILSEREPLNLAELTQEKQLSVAFLETIY